MAQRKKDVKEFTPSAGGPPPAHLLPEAVAIWHEYHDMLCADGRLRPDDLGTFEVFVETFAQYRAAVADLKVAGRICVSAAGARKTSPELAAVALLGRELDRYCTHFLLSPRARGQAGIPISAPPTQKDAFEEI